MPPQRRKQLGSAALSNPLLDGTQTPPVSDLRDAEWPSSTQDAPERLTVKHPDVAEMGSPAAVPDGGSGTAPVERFAHRPDNPRFTREYDPAKDESLAAMGNTLEDFGVVQPLTVVSRAAWLRQNPKHEAEIPESIWWVVLMGNRRLAIAAWKRLETLKFSRDDSLADPTRARKASLIENHHHKDLDPIREAEEIQVLLEDTGISQRALAEEIGFSNGYVSQRLHLLRLVDPFQDLVSARKITVVQARPIAALTKDDQLRLLELGAPYSPARLRQPDERGFDESLATRDTVKIAARSTAPDVVQTLTQNLSLPLVREVARLLNEQLTQ